MGVGCRFCGKNFFQNLETCCVYGGVAVFKSKPPRQFERLGYPPKLLISSAGFRTVTFVLEETQG